jgi:hypothetical protein
MDCKHRIAVIAVHGVGDQQPRSSATHAADLLHGMCKGYSWLGQSVVRIPVEAVSASVTNHGIPERKETKAATCVNLKTNRVGGNDRHDSRVHLIAPFSFLITIIY